jgi:CBS domain-containing protein
MLDRMSTGQAATSSLIAQLRAELMRHVPFAQMSAADVDALVSASQQAYFEPGEVLLDPSRGVVQEVFIIRRGSVSGRKGIAETQGGFEFGAGELFPLDAAFGARAVTSTYTATIDTFCLLVPVVIVQEVASRSAAFADFVNRRVMHLLQLSRNALQASHAAQTATAQSLETPLGELIQHAPYSVAPQTALAQALRKMEELRIGSVLVTDEVGGQTLGILTHRDVLSRVTLPQIPLSTPISTVMTQPVATLTTRHTAHDAALMMARLSIRHVPVTDGTQAHGRVVGIVSERDLFALQRISLKQISAEIRNAPDVGALQAAANDIRAFARNLLGQGVRARQITELISHLNDLLTERLVALIAPSHSVDLSRACWLSFGSEGRSEQTIATDQDNGLVFESADPANSRPALLAFAREVNEALNACGYPLCKGNVMASNPDCCLTSDEWLERFAQWIDHGAPADLLKASIYFDVRPIAGESALVDPLRQFLDTAGHNARFLKQMADNALANSPALNWHGAIDGRSEQGHTIVDLKLRGTAVFVDAARLFALRQGVGATSTRLRLEGAAKSMGVPSHEAEAWIGAFEYLQLLRLQEQLARSAQEAVQGVTRGPNEVDVQQLNDFDRRLLKEALLMARRIQQRVELDHSA